MKLINIIKSNKPEKKYMAIFMVDNKEKVVHFGSAGMSDYTIHKDDERKARYISRHQKNEDWNNPLTAGSLSRWILWNKTTLQSSINDFKRRFGV